MKFLSIIILTFFLLFPFLSFAQPGPGEDPGYPITGAIALLLAGAFGLGIKTFSKKKKE